MGLPARDASSLQPLHRRHIIVRNTVDEFVVTAFEMFGLDSISK